MPIRMTPMRAATVVACMSLAGQGLTSSAAFAQAKQPAAPAQAQPQAGQQPQGPIKVDLQPSQADWTKVCGKDQGAGKEICYTTRDFTTAPDQPPAIAVAVYDIKGEDQRLMRLLMPVGLLLRPGFRFSVDKGPQTEGAFEICMPNGCFAEAKVKGSLIDSLKKGTSLNVAVKNTANNEVTFVVPLAGFGKAFDGAPIDPKVLQQQQEQLQQQLEAKAKQQRQMLEQQQNGAPAAPAAGAPAPAAGAPAAAPKQ